MDVICHSCLSFVVVVVVFNLPYYSNSTSFFYKSPEAQMSRMNTVMLAHTNTKTAADGYSRVIIGAFGCRRNVRPTVSGFGL